MRIRNREIGPGNPVFFVAEIGISHGGDFELAKQGIHLAHNAGVEAVKFQHHIAAEEMEPAHPWFDTVKRCELSIDQLTKLRDLAHKRGLAFVCTPFSTRAARELIAMGVDAIKVGSGEVSHLEMLDVIRDRWSGPVILSTGMHNQADSFGAWQRLGAAPDRIAWLYCRSKYPTQPAETGLEWIVDYQDVKVIGFSMHSPPGDIGPGIAACALGYNIVEVHMRPYEDWQQAGNDPDDAVSQWWPVVEGLTRLGTQAWEAIQPIANTDDERELARIATHRCYARCDIAAGEPLADKVGYRRTRHGKGLPASAHDEIVRSYTETDMKAGDLICSIGSKVEAHV